MFLYRPLRQSFSTSETLFLLHNHHHWRSLMGLCKNPFSFKFRPSPSFKAQYPLLYDWRTTNSTYKLSLDFEGYGPSDINAEFVHQDYITGYEDDSDVGDCNALDDLAGPCLDLHNHVHFLLHAGDLDAASAYAQEHSSYCTPTVFTCNAIIAAMLNAKRYNDAIALFHYFFQLLEIHPSMASFNLLLKAYLDAGQVEMGIKVYRHVSDSLDWGLWGYSPIMYRVLTKGLVETGLVFKALDILREMLKCRGEVDSIVYNNLIKGFLDLDDLGKANELFKELLKEKNTDCDWVVNPTFMDWFFKKGKEEEAMKIYKSMLDRGIEMSPDIGNTLLDVLLKHGKDAEAWKLFDQMLDNHAPPVFEAVDSNSYNIMVNECFKSSKYCQAIEVFKRSGKRLESKPFVMDILGYNNIIAKLCEKKLLVEAEKLFGEVSSSKSVSPDGITYRTLIETYLQEERVEDALRLFTKMVKCNMRVTATFGNIVFDELVKNNKVEEAAEILEIMGESDVKPDPINYEIVIWGLCNQSLLDKSRNLIIQMLKHKVGITPMLWKILPKIFGKARWSNKIEDEYKLQYSTGHSSPSKSFWITGQSQDNMQKLKEKVETMERKYAKMRAQIKAIKSTSYQSRLK